MSNSVLTLPTKLESLSIFCVQLELQKVLIMWIIRVSTIQGLLNSHRRLFTGSLY